MNLAVESSPRLACRVVRGWISLVGDDSRAVQSSHVAGCPDCQAFFSAGEELELALRREATGARVAPRASLEQDILRAVRQSARPARRSLTLPVLSLGGVAAAVAAAIMLLQPSRVPPAPRPSASPGEIAAANRVVSTVPDNLLAELRPQAEALLQQDPLQNELDSVVSDARSAMRFLALNFLPADSAPLAALRNNG